MPREARQRLGRGLSSLIRNSIADANAGQYAASPAAPNTPMTPTTAQAVAVTSPPVEAVMPIPVERIHPNPSQPRRSFAPNSLAELADSIRTHGILEPLVVSPRADQATGEEASYYLVAGERRFRAAQLAGKTTVPCILRQATRREMLELALIENIHREDLNPVERATAYRDLIDQFSLTQDQAAQRVGEKRSTVANFLRMLDMSDDVLSLISSGELTFGHAKVLAALAGQGDRQLLLARRVVQDGLSVRQLEQLVDELQTLQLPGGAAAPGTPSGSKPKSAYLSDVERQLTEAVGTRVCIRPGRAKHSGRIIISYYSLDDFDRIAKCLGISLES